MPSEKVLLINSNRMKPPVTPIALDYVGHALKKDGYSVEFSLSSVMSDCQIIIVHEKGKYRIVAASYEGAYWVKDAYKIEVI